MQIFKFNNIKQEIVVWRVFIWETVNIVKIQEKSIKIMGKIRIISRKIILKLLINWMEQLIIYKIMIQM